MTKNRLLLAVGVLTALALTALPSSAFAGEFTATCSSGATCLGTVEGTGTAIIEDDSKSTLGTIKCTGVVGSITQTSGSSTGSAQVQFNGCADVVFNYKCSNTGVTGQITTNVLTSHLIKLEDGSALPVGLLLTGVNVTFYCPLIAVPKTVTGSIIAEIENPSCGSAKTHHTISFENSAAGAQRWRQITTTGAMLDLTVSSHTLSEETTTTSWQATAHVNYPESKTVRLNC